MVKGSVPLLRESEAVEGGEEGKQEIGLGSGEGVVSWGEGEGSCGGAPAKGPSLVLGVVGEPEGVIGWGFVLVGTEVVVVEVLWYSGHVSPTFVTVLLGSAIGNVWPNDPRACSRGRVDGRPVIRVGKCAVKPKVDM